jgi:hypothetical protein
LLKNNLVKNKTRSRKKSTNKELTGSGREVR